MNIVYNDIKLNAMSRNVTTNDMEIEVKVQLTKRKKVPVCGEVP